MKKTFTIIILFFIVQFSYSQNCGSNGPAACSVNSNFSGVISSYDSFECIVDGVPFSDAFSIRIPGTFNGAAINSISLDSITNLPCGMCWAINSNSLNIGDVYCVNIQGTTNDSPGVYKINIYGTVAFTYFGTQYTYSGAFDLIGVQFYVRVIGSGDVCPAQIIQPQDTTHTRLSCGPAVLNCPATLPFNLNPLSGTACNYSAINYSLPPNFSNIEWVIYSPETSYDTIFDTSFNPYSLAASQQLTDVIATDTNGCVIDMYSPVATSTGLYASPEICIATMDSSIGHNVLVWSRIDDSYSATISSYNVYSSFNDTTTSPSTLLGSVPFNNEMMFIDTINAPLTGVIKYQLSMQDTCGAGIRATDVFAPPYLQIDTSPGLVTLRWNYMTYNIFNFPNYTMLLWKTLDSITWQQIPIGIQTLDTGYVAGLWRFKYNDTLQANENPEYMVEVSFQNPCQPSPQRSAAYGSTFSNRVKRFPLVNSINNLESSGSIKVFPNPANDMVKIYVANETGAVSNITLLDITGKTVIQFTKSLNGTDSYLIDLSPFSSGIYFIKVSTATGNYMQKLVKR